MASFIPGPVASWPMWAKILLSSALILLLVPAWPLVLALVYGYLLLCVLHTGKLRFGLAGVMLIAALAMQGWWGWWLAGVLFSPKSSAIVTQDTPQVAGAATSATSEEGRVLQAVSGDTFDMDLAGQAFRVKMIGISSPPALGEGADKSCFAAEARSFLKAVTDGQKITLQADARLGDRTATGELLRYVTFGVHGSLNGRMLEEGVVKLDESVTGYTQEASFKEAQNQARSANKGLWGACSNGTPVPSVTPSPSPTASPKMKARTVKPKATVQQQVPVVVSPSPSPTPITPVTAETPIADPTPTP